MFSVQTLPARLVSAYLRTFRCTMSRWRLVAYAIRQTRTYGHMLGSATVGTHHGFKMDLDLRDWVDQHIYATGDYEDYTGKTILGLIGPGDAVADIGANVGFFTLLMARGVGPGGKVVAFEPAPTTRVRLLRNIALNRLANVEVREEAVADAEGEATFYSGPVKHSGVASLRAHGESDGSYKVRTSRLESCVPPGFRLRLIKMDVEGAEYRALVGMRNLLDRDGPDVIVEVSAHFLRDMGTSAQALIDFLLRLGYRMYWIDWNGLVMQSGWHEHLPQQFNALFTRRPALPEGLVVKKGGELPRA